jgi:hypothetical protein
MARRAFVACRQRYFTQRPARSSSNSENGSARTRARLVDAVAIDVSPGGLRLVSATPLKAGTKIEVALILDGEVLDALATVCWSAPHGGKHFAAGLSFE